VRALNAPASSRGPPQGARYHDPYNTRRPVVKKLYANQGPYVQVIVNLSPVLTSVSLCNTLYSVSLHKSTLKVVQG
jgi:hypothetical protein